MGLAALAVVGMGVPPAQAVNMDLPNASEVEYYSPEAQQFYAAGVVALDKVDYVNAYSLLSKAAALQPAAVRLNHIVATLAIYQGRHNPADEAQDYYETAVNSYDNILRVPTITADLRRQVTNQLKSAQQERDNLAQRDVLREAAGTSFIMKYNHEYSQAPERPAGITEPAAPATTLSQEIINPMTILMQTQGAQAPGGMPGMGLPGQGMGMPGQPAMGMPGQPGMGMPGQPGGIPGEPIAGGPGGNAF